MVYVLVDRSNQRLFPAAWEARIGSGTTASSNPSPTCPWSCPPLPVHTPPASSPSPTFPSPHNLCYWSLLPVLVEGDHCTSMCWSILSQCGIDMPYGTFCNILGWCMGLVLTWKVFGIGMWVPNSIQISSTDAATRRPSTTGCNAQLVGMVASVLEIWIGLSVLLLWLASNITKEWKKKVSM